MSVYAHIVNEAPLPLWGLTSHERYRRLLEQTGVTAFVDDFASLDPGDTVLVLRGDYLLDPRLVGSLAKSPNVVLEAPASTSRLVVAAHVPAGLASQARALVSGDGAAQVRSSPALRVETPGTLASAFHEFLLKSEPPFVEPIRPDTQRALECRLFAGAYKGVTDLVTKWLWPVPARWATRLCVTLGLSPNQITAVSVILVIVAGALFAEGQYGWGLLAAWIMTFLDTVDGKLARVTVTSSRLGNALDKNLDLIHPPLWYLLWGLGLTVFEPEIPGLSLERTLWAIMIGYVAGRLVEGAFLLWLGRFGIFCWRPIDSYFRLVTARRNPNLIVLTVSVVLGRPDLGLAGVAVWTVLSTLMLLGRLGLAVRARSACGPLRPWLADVATGADRSSLAARLFAERPPLR